MPQGEAEFFELLRIWFPCIYDISLSFLSLRLSELIVVLRILDEERQVVERWSARGSG